VLRYLNLLVVQVKASALVTLQYRLDFAVNVVMSLFWVAASLVPLVVLFSARETVAGWRWPEAMLVAAAFTCLKAVLEGAIQPSLQAVVEHIRRGTLDFILLKPVDAQFMVSTAKFDLVKLADVAGGLGLAAYSFHHLGRTPTLPGLLAALMLLAGALLVLYSTWILVVSLAFLVVKVDNLSYLFMSLFDAARWPSSIFKGTLSFVFTFIIPLAILTTYPALALLDQLAWWRGLTALGVSLVFAGVARVAWLGSIKRYTSAGG
jgi:ABC-2 type transport system permease protein